MNPNCPCGKIMAYHEDPRGDYWRCRADGYNRSVTPDEMLEHYSRKGGIP